MANIPVRINLLIKTDNGNPATNRTVTNVKNYSLDTTVQEVKDDVIALLNSSSSVPGYQYDSSKEHLSLHIHWTIGNQSKL